MAKNIIKEKQPFERLVVSKANLLEMFKVGSSAIHLFADFILVSSTTSTRSTLFKTRFPMELPPRYIDAVPWWICVAVPTFPTRGASNRLPWPK
jgi:hypothetical protein